MTIKSPFMYVRFMFRKPAMRMLELSNQSLLAFVCSLAVPMACNSGSANPGVINACATEGAAPATSGGDHGPPWEPPPPMTTSVDDTAGEKLDIGQGRDLPDVPAPGVTGWERDPGSGVQYRRLTENEIEDNQWYGNLLLVALEDSFVADASSGLGKVTLDLPLADAHPLSLQENLPVVSVPLVHQSSRDFAGVVERVITETGSATIKARRPVFHSYIQNNLEWGTVDDTAIQMFAQDEGGIVVSGATYGRTFWLEGPQEDYGDLITIEIEPASGRQAFLLHTQHGPPLSQRQLDEDDVAAQIQGVGAVLSGSPPSSSLVDSAPVVAGGVLPPINQCTDGLNNDPDIDAVADGCDFACMQHPDFGTDLYPEVVPIWEYARPFAVVGDAEWCSTHPNNWEDLLHAYGRGAEQTLNWVEAPTATFPGPRVPPFRLAGLYCWVFEDAFLREECHGDGVCPDDSSDYAFKEVGTNWNSGAPSYLDNVWSATDAWVADAVNENAPDVAHPLQNVAVIVSQQDPNENSGTIGLALYHNVHYSKVGGAVVLGIGNNGDVHPVTMGLRIAHEFGHTHGLEHDPAQVGDHRSFMHATLGTAPVLDEEQDSAVLDQSVNPPVLLTQYEAWTSVATLKRFPRPPGFGYVGCSEMPDNCPSGLTCTNAVQGFACLP